MPRKTRRQYRKKNKRGGMSHSKIASAINESTKGIMNTRDNVTRKARGLFSRFKLSNFFGSKKKDPQEQSTRASAPVASASAPGSAPGSAPTASSQSSSAPPASPALGGKRKSRRFRKKKGKVTLQGGRRRRSRKSKSRRRRR